MPKYIPGTQRLDTSDWDPNANVQYVEKAGPFGSSIKPHKLPIAELKLHLRGRGLDPFGLRRDLERELQKALDEEAKEAWEAYQAARRPVREPVRNLIEEFKVEREEPDLDIGMLNEWITATEFNWEDNEESLVQKKKARAEQYPVPLERLRISIDPFPDESRAKEDLRLEQEELEKRAARNKLLVENKSNVCQWTAIAPGNFKKYACTNPCQVLREHYAEHVDATYCAYHSTLCSSMAHAPVRSLATRAQALEVADDDDDSEVSESISPEEAESQLIEDQNLQPLDSSETGKKDTNKVEKIQNDENDPKDKQKDEETKDEALKRPKVTRPNELGFCVECYFNAKKRRPAKFELNNVPGVLVRTDEVRKALREAGTQIEGDKNNASQGTSKDKDEDEVNLHVGGVLKRQEEAMKTFLCKWRAIDGKGNKLACNNMRIRDPLTGVMARRCGFHTRYCGMAHIDRVVKNEIPNELGICVRHYVARRREKPEEQWEIMDRIPRYPGVFVLEEASQDNENEMSESRNLDEEDTTQQDAANNRSLSRGERLVLHLVAGAKQEFVRIQKEASKFMIESAKDLVLIAKDLSHDLYIPAMIQFGDNCAQRLVKTAKNTRSKIPSRDAVQKQWGDIKTRLDTTKFKGRNWKMFGKPLSGEENEPVANEHDQSATDSDVFSLRQSRRFDRAGAIDSKRSLGSRMNMMFSHIKRKDLLRATTIIQRFARSRMGRLKFFFHRKAIRIQRIVRGHLGRCAAKAERMLRNLRFESLDLEWAKEVLSKHLIGYAVRIRVRKMKAEVLRHKNAIVCIQRSWRHFQFKRDLCSNLANFAKRNRAAKAIQRIGREFIVAMRLFYTKEERDNAAAGLQKLYRGWKGRVKVLNELEDMERYWEWVGSSAPKFRFYSLLKRSRYPVNHTILNSSLQVSKSPKSCELARESESKPQASSLYDYTIRPQKTFERLSDQQPNWDISMFAKFDAGRSGYVRRDEFERVIREIPHSSSLFSNVQISLMLKLWTEQDGLVNYFNFLRLARSETSVCSTHRCWACPVCATRGRCTKCTCSRFKATEKRGPKSLICSVCNHYVTMHQVVARPRLDQDYQEGKALTRAQLKQILSARQGFVDPPKQTNKQQIRIIPRELAMSIKFGDLHSGIESNSVPDKSLQVKVVETESEYQEAVHGICEDIISTLIAESEKRVSSLRSKVGWQGVGKLGEAAEAISFEGSDSIAQLPNMVRQKPMYEASLLREQQAVAVATEGAIELARQANRGTSARASSAVGTTRRESTFSTVRPHSTSASTNATGKFIKCRRTTAISERASSDAQQNLASLGKVAISMIKKGSVARPNTAHVLSSVKKQIRGHSGQKSRNKGSTRQLRARSKTKFKSNTILSQAKTALEKLHDLEVLRVTQGEKVSSNGLGPLLLANAKAPHTLAHHDLQNQVAETCAGVTNGDAGLPQTQAAKYVQRAYRAEVRRKQLIIEIGEFKTSLRHFSFEFSVTDPVPLIVNDTLKLTTDTAPLYVDMLLALSLPECQLLEDKHALTTFIFQSFSFVHRHWRKLVHDIREGTLDPFLQMQSRERERVEMFLKPQPKRAQMLDDALREMGFYRFSTGVKPASKMETILKAKQGGLREIQGTFVRRHSFSIPEQQESQDGRDEFQVQPVPEAVQQGDDVVDNEVKYRLPELHKPKTKTHRRHSLEPSAESERGAEEADVHIKTYIAMTKPRAQPDPVVKATGRNARTYECSHPGCGQCFTRSSTAEEHARKYHYGRYRLAVERNEVDTLMRFHWPSDIPWDHRNARQTAQEAEDMKKAVAIDKQYKCPRVGCEKRFATSKELSLHLSVSHIMQEKLVETLGVVEESEYVQFIGPTVMVPPGLPPRRVGVPCCSKHWVLLVPYCAECLPLIQARVPMCPITFAETAKIELPVQKGNRVPTVQKLNAGGMVAVKLRISLVNHAGGKLGDGIQPVKWKPEKEHLEQNRKISKSKNASKSNQSFANLSKSISSLSNVSKSTQNCQKSARKSRFSTSTVIIANVVAFLTDKLGRKFVAYSTYRSASDLKCLGVSNMKPQMNWNNELVEEIQVRFAPVSCIVGTCCVLTCDREEYRRRQRTGTLPLFDNSSQVYFAQDMFCASSLEIIGERTTIYFRSKLHTGLYVAETDDGVYGVLREDFYAMKKLQNKKYNRQAKTNAKA